MEGWGQYTIAAHKIRHPQVIDHQLHKMSRNRRTSNHAGPKLGTVKAFWSRQAEYRVEHGRHAVQRRALLIGDGP